MAQTPNHSKPGSGPHAPGAGPAPGTNGTDGRNIDRAVLALAKKKLPPELLADLGITRATYDNVTIPYRGRAGKLLFARTRLAKGPQRFYQPPGVKLAPYGLWLLDGARGGGVLFIVEGESDAWTLMHHGLPVLALPGANTAGCLDVADLDGFKDVYVVPDTDKSGGLLVDGLRDRLGVDGFAGRVHVLRLPATLEEVDIKDVSDLHCHDPAGFLATLTELMKASEPLPLKGDADDAPPPKKEPFQSTDRSAPVDPPKLKKTRLSDVEIEPIEFLVPGLIPTKALTILAGEGGLGKSSLSLALAAAVSRGRPAFGLDYNAGPPADVLLVSCEDDVRNTIKPRLLAVGADTARVQTIDGLIGPDGRVIGFDLNCLASIANDLEESPGVRLLVIDPVTAFVGRTGVNDHRDSELRSLLAPLADLARKYNLAVVLVMHFNKAVTTRAVHRVIGGVGYVNAARAAYAVVRDPDEKERRLMLPLKNNLTSDPRGLAFTLEALPADDADEIILKHGSHLKAEQQFELARQLYRPRWLGTVDVTADDALAPPKQERGPSKVTKCAEWLKQYVGLSSVPSAELDKAAVAAGFSLDNLKEAKAVLRPHGLRSRPAAFGGGWVVGFDQSEDAPAIVPFPVSGGETEPSP